MSSGLCDSRTVEARLCFEGVGVVGTNATVLSSFALSKTSSNCGSVLGVLGDSDSEEEGE